MHVLAIISGGMDSAVLAWWLKQQSYDIRLLSFCYGQRHGRELHCASELAKCLSAQHDIIDISSIRPFLGGSALTDGIPVPEGHYAAETMRQTVVSNRNAIMLAIAWGIAVSEQRDAIAYAAHSGDHYIYPDCRPEFVKAISEAFRIGTEGHRHESMQILAPFINASKADLVRIGLDLGVPFENTWTCYNGGEISCGRCGSCNERLEAFMLAGSVDPLPYENR